MIRTLMESNQIQQWRQDKSVEMYNVSDLQSSVLARRQIMSLAASPMVRYNENANRLDEWYDKQLQ